MERELRGERRGKVQFDDLELGFLRQDLVDVGRQQGVGF